MSPRIPHQGSYNKNERRAMFCLVYFFSELRLGRSQEDNQFHYLSLI